MPRRWTRSQAINDMAMKNIRLVSAAKFAFDRLNQMTSEEFSRGGDRLVRRKLAEALDLDLAHYDL